jgi:DNA-binding Lrp family transcriptional regulator
MGYHGAEAGFEPLVPEPPERERGAMQTIFVMVKCELGKAYLVADETVQAVEQVSEVYSTSGEYDLLIKCYLPADADIGHFVTENLQTLPGVKDTFTIIAFKAFT